MGEVIDIKDFKPLAKKDSKESDLAMFSILYFTEHFGELLAHLEDEVRYALIISVYRFMLDAESNKAVDITKEGFSIDNEASEELREKVFGAVDFDKEKLH